MEQGQSGSDFKMYVFVEPILIWPYNQLHMPIFSIIALEWQGAQILSKLLQSVLVLLEFHTVLKLVSWTASYVESRGKWKARMSIAQWDKYGLDDRGAILVRWQEKLFWFVSFFLYFLFFHQSQSVFLHLYYAIVYLFLIILMSTHLDSFVCHIMKYIMS